MCFQLKQLKKQPEKKFRLERDSNPWPCDTGAMLYPLSCQATWIDGQLWVRHIPDDSEHIWIWIYENHGSRLGCFFNFSSWKHTVRITISLMFIHSSHIWFSYIHIHYHRVYDELTIDHLSMWLDSSVDRALHRYRKAMGSSPVQASFFFQVAFSTA